MRIKPAKILCAIDFSEFSDNILAHGSLLASEFGSKLYLCHIVPPNINLSSHLITYFDYSEVEREMMETALKRLNEIASGLDVECEVIVKSGHPAARIKQIVAEKQIEMVIAATHGRSGMERFLIGSVTQKLVKVLDCPILVLHGHSEANPAVTAQGIHIKKILVGCDFSPDSQLAFEYALSFAQEFQTQLHLAHVIRPEERPDIRFQIEAGAQETLSGTWDRLVYPGVESDSTISNVRMQEKLINLVPKESLNWCTPVTVLLEGQPYKELVAYADKEGIDMIVLGIRGHHLLEEFLVGSTTDRVIQRASCPVLAVRNN